MKENINILYITSLLKHVLDKKDKIIPLHEPNFKGREWEYIRNCLDTGWVSSAGKYVDEFEKKIVEHTNASYAISVVNGLIYSRKFGAAYN